MPDQVVTDRWYINIYDEEPHFLRFSGQTPQAPMWTGRRYGLEVADLRGGPVMVTITSPVVGSPSGEPILYHGSYSLHTPTGSHPMELVEFPE